MSVELETAEWVLQEVGARNITRRGDELIHSCPLPFGGHKNNDANPSAALNYRKQVFNCKGCGSSGTMAWLLAVCTGREDAIARNEIAGHVASKLTPEKVEELVALIEEEYRQQNVSHKKIPTFSTIALRPFLAGEMHPYWIKRGISHQTAMEFQLGFDANNSRVIIPHFWEGGLCGWQARTTVNDPQKYDSTPDFPTSTTLFNYPWPIERTRSLLVVESPMSVLVLHSAGIDNVVATFGAEVSDLQIALMARAQSVTVWMDGDTPGYKAQRKITDALLGQTVVECVIPGEDKDPADEIHRALNLEAHSYPASLLL